jgi:membrane associated rhomboid family serine protease
VSGPAELAVVCKSCGSEVSPYVTECPYCGTRLRRRAPKLERRGDELEAKLSRRARRRLRRVERAERDPYPRFGERPYATWIAIGAPAILVLVQRALDKPLVDFGAIVGPVGSEGWRYLAAPFVYADIGYLFVVGVTVAIFASALERRLGGVPVGLLVLACGALGMLAADGIETSLHAPTHLILAAGGNGIALGVLAAWVGIALGERRRGEEEHDLVGALVVAAVLLVLPLVEDTANVWAGLTGGAVGGLAGFTASLGRRG